MGRRTGALGALDEAGYRAVRSLALDPSAVRVVRRFSKAGEHGVLWLGLGAAGALADRRRGRLWRRAAVRVAWSYAVSTAIKLAIRRPRPALNDLPPLMATRSGLSFPSSHAVTSFCAARGYGRLVPAPPLYALAVAMVASRLYLGVHYPSDVLAGAALGMVLA